MKRLLGALVALATLSFAVAVLAQPAAAPVTAPVTAPAAAAMPPLEVYGRLPRMEEVALSPDGEKLAYISVEGEARRVHVQTLAGQLLGMIGVGNQKVRDVRWGDNTHLLITTSTTGRVCTLCGKGENFMVQGYDVLTRKFTVMMGTTNGAVGAFVGGPPYVRRVSGRDIVLVNGFIERKINDTTWFLPAPFRLNLETGHGALFDFNNGVMDDKGVVVAAVDQVGQRWRLITFEGRAIKELVVRENAGLDAPVLFGFGRTPNTVMIGEIIDGEYGYIEVSLATGAQTSFQLPFAGAEPLFDPATDHLVGFMGFIDDALRIEYFEPERAAGWARVMKSFKDKNPRVVSWASNFKKAIVIAEGAGDTGTYYLMDFTAGTAIIVGSRYPAIRPDQINEVRYIRYKAADGLEIPAFLTLPRVRDPRNLPLIVLPHGGPQLRDYPGFDWWSQALAARGYAVLQPQFRGSDGYGARFVQAGYGEWGRKMQTDLSDGVRWLAGQGMIDPARVCIVGASYGGYAAMAASALEPGVYRCAVSVAGVSDLKRMLRQEKEDAGGSANALGVRYWSRYLGAASINDASLSAISPISLAARASAPILLIHGKDDTVVPFVHSESLARALQRAGKPVELVTLQGEDHWLTRSATRLQMLQATVSFLEKHNPPS